MCPPRCSTAPGGQQAAFIAEVTAEEHAEHLGLTVEAHHDYQRGILPAGHGARDLIAAFTAVDKALARHDPGPVTVIDDRRVEQLLKATAKTLHVGVANYCWFTNPAKALCLKLAGTPEATEPLIGMCDSARCPQAPPPTPSAGMGRARRSHPGRLPRQPPAVQARTGTRPGRRRPGRAIVTEIDAAAATAETDHDQ